MDNGTLENKFNKEYEKLIKKTPRPNILLAGETGAGKSSLINLVFGKSVAKVGTGHPVTQNINKYDNPRVSVCLYDSRGYELGSEGEKAFLDDVLTRAADGSLPPEEQIHLVWYCISASGHRITDYDIKAIQTLLQNKFPVALIFTKSDLVSEQAISELGESARRELDIPYFEISSTKPADFAISLKELVNWSFIQLPERLREAFIGAQHCNIEKKWEHAHFLIIQHCAAAFAVGFTPIPMSDAPILVGNQMALLARIFMNYDLDSYEEMLKGFGLSAFVDALMPMLGKSAVGAILKFIPGVGTIVGGLISGSVAAVLTGAFGEAASFACYKLSQAILEGNKEQIDELMQNFGKLILETATEIIKKKIDIKDMKCPEDKKTEKNESPEKKKSEKDDESSEEKKD